ncbi:class I SAM-dependent methyltransferase [Nocardia sp. NPDC058518]|uniref:class I SAM-dependent methyltransferase n=1 Tax=Nocardia sp. NPDC058518 TaxID=3346534 RepID=UPI0036530A0D
MPTTSLWEQTLTFFPQFVRELNDRCDPGATVTVIGASDGKFVLPLAAAGYRVIAVENDPQALHGGDVLLPVAGLAYAPSLAERVAEAGLTSQVRIEPHDFFDAALAEMQADAVWTSCSWHYSANHRRPLREFIGRMQDLLEPGGLLGAEFMMPVEDHHYIIEHYTTPDKLFRRFPCDTWEVLLTLRTDPFIERPHVGQLHDHTHRMGVFFAAKREHLDEGRELDEA